MLSTYLPIATVESIRLAMTGAFFDTATVKRRVAPSGVASGGLGHTPSQYGDYDDEHSAYEYTTRCSFIPARSSESGGIEQAADGSGSFSLPFGIEATIDRFDRIELTHTAGVALETPRLYAFSGPIIPGLAAMSGPVVLVTGQG